MSTGRALYVPCYPGELGWELINYAPHVNHVFSRHDYDEVHCIVREGREVLYPMASHCHPISLSTKKSMGNNGVKPPHNKILANLRKQFSTVDTVKVPVGGCKYVKHRKYLRYAADDDSLWKWRHIPANSVVFCVRGRNFGVHKNWSPKNWKKLIEHIMGKGYTPVVTGIKELISIDLPNGCVDVQNETTLSDLLAIMKKSKFVIGQSTGPLHFASLSGIPHAVWGSPRIRDRYLKSWNPHHTKVEYQICPSGGFNCSVKDAIALADRMIERVG